MRANRSSIIDSRKPGKVRRSASKRATYRRNTGKHKSLFESNPQQRWPYSNLGTKKTTNSATNSYARQKKPSSWCRLPRITGELQKEYDLLPLNIRQRVNRVMEKRNSLVVEYNKIASALLGCNSNASFLGSELQANLAHCYILVYMVKPSPPLLKSVALILNARQEIEKQPSFAKDSGTPKRTAMHLLNKMVNNIRGLKEISAQTAAACVLGMPAETCTHEFHLAFVDAALKYLDELHADNKKGYRFYNKKC